MLQNIHCPSIGVQSRADLWDVIISWCSGTKGAPSSELEVPVPRTLAFLPLLRKRVFILCTYSRLDDGEKNRDDESECAARRHAVNLSSRKATVMAIEYS